MPCPNAHASKDDSPNNTAVDALSAVINFTRRKLEKGLVVIAVSLDIKNAFNSIS